MLADVQKTSTVNRLSDRIVVDIIEKIINQNNLKLFFTTDGTEYMLPDYLDQ